MMVLVDTSIWSLALRRRRGGLNRHEEALKWELDELVREGRAQIAGPIRQEILSGIREPAQFEGVRQDLRAFEDVAVTTDDYEEAAQANNRCRAAGIAGSPVDFLLCALALRRGWSIFTTDADFSRYASRVPLRLHLPRPPATP